MADASRTATGYSQASFEDAYRDAAEQVLSGAKGNPDEMFKIRVSESGALYGGIAGFWNRYYVTVQLERESNAGGTDTLLAPASGASEQRVRLELKLEAHPGEIYINEMPGTGHHPQPKAVNFILSVHNPTRQNLHFENRDSAVVRVDVLKGRTTYWRGPEIILPVVTHVDIAAGETKTFGAVVWHIPDVRVLKGFDLNAVGIFCPNGQSTHIPLPVKSAQL